MSGIQNGDAVAPDEVPTPVGDPVPLHLFRRVTMSGAIGSLFFWALSLTPSLLPRSWAGQAFAGALSAASGYMFGAAFGWAIRALGPRATLAQWSERHGGRVRQILLWVLGAVVLVGSPLWLIRQNDHRELVNLEPLSWVAVIPMLLVTGVLLAVLILGGRAIGWLVRRLERFTNRFVPTWVALVATAVIVIAIAGVLSTRLGDSFEDWARDQFGITNRSTDPGIAVPTSPTVSGSPESLVAWDTLGRQGRTFVATAPTTDELAQFAGSDTEVVEPIRVYVGLKSARSPEGRADLLIEELERTGGLEREALVVVTVTGTGWVDPDAALAIEYMYGGDTAIVAMQYSYLPSWISFLVDGPVATETAELLNVTIRDAVMAMPAEDRPKVLVFGESLGSLGSEQALAQPDLDASLDLLRTIPSGTLYSGPTYGNPVWRQLVAGRDETSPVWRPVYEGGAVVRVANEPFDFDTGNPSWEPPRIAYLHHPSDPVGYWNPSILWRSPDWMSEPVGMGVSPRARWFPVVTFWQVVADLMAGFGTDPGFGHNYADEFVSGWAAVASPDGWTAEDSTRLHGFLQALE